VTPASVAPPPLGPTARSSRTIDSYGSMRANAGSATALVSSASGLLALQKNGHLVSCRYHVGDAESEASARLLCHNETRPSASVLEGMSSAIRRR
jgi:hypothetical protein